MILPTKRITVERSLLGIGAEVLILLETPKTVSRLWYEFKNNRLQKKSNSLTVTYDWFILALDLLYMLNAIGQENGLLQRFEP